MLEESLFSAQLLKYLGLSGAVFHLYFTLPFAVYL